MPEPHFLKILDCRDMRGRKLHLHHFLKMKDAY
jgi:hypothetical protein